MSKFKFLLLCVISVLLIAFVLILFSGCKTRQVVNESQRSETKVDQEQSSQVAQKSSELEADSSATREQTSEESENVSETSLEMEVDSIKTDVQGNTTIYAKAGTKATIKRKAQAKSKHSRSIDSRNATKKNKTSQVDSTGSNNQTLDAKTDDQNKQSAAQGSGQTWPWVTGAIVVLLAICLFIYKR